MTITSLVDDPDGAGPAEAIDLDGKGSCDVPQTIEPDDTYSWELTRTISGNAGDAKTTSSPPPATTTTAIWSATTTTRRSR